MSKDKKGNKSPMGELECSDESYVLKVVVKLESENGVEVTGIDSQATLPVLLTEEHLLLAEPRLRKQLDSTLEPFKLIFASKMNKLIEASNRKHVAENAVDAEGAEEDTPPLEIEEPNEN